jgi:hypothetical protein
MTWAEQEFRVWHGIQSPEPPAAAFDYAEIRQMAQRMLETRRTRFPQLVAKGRMSTVDAEAQIATFETIVAEWHWMATGEGAPASAEHLPAMREALDQSIATIAQIAREDRGFSAELAAQAEWVIAMAWHLEPGRRTRACRARTFAMWRELVAEKEARRAA